MEYKIVRGVNSIIQIDEVVEYSGDNFDYPIESLSRKDCEWNFNGNSIINEADISKFKELMYSEYNAVYYIQNGDCDGQSWLILRSKIAT